MLFRSTVDESGVGRYVESGLGLIDADSVLQNVDTGVNVWDQEENNYAGVSTQTFDDGSTLTTDDATGNIVGGTDTEGNLFTVDESGVGRYVESGLGLVDADSVLQNVDTGVNVWDQPENNYVGISTQVFDDGSEIRVDDDTGQIVGGTDTEGRDFVVDEDGVAHYTDTGTNLGGPATTNFGGRLADPADVNRLLNYNSNIPAGPTTTTPKIGRAHV